MNLDEPNLLRCDYITLPGNCSSNETWRMGLKVAAHDNAYILSVCQAGKHQGNTHTYTSQHTHSNSSQPCTNLASVSCCGLPWWHFRGNWACAPSLLLLPLVSPSVWAAGRRVRALRGHEEAEILHVKTWNYKLNSELLWTPTQPLQWWFTP